MIKKITSIILALSLLLITMPQVMANSVTSTLIDLSDFYQYPNTTASSDRNYNGYFYPRHSHLGHYFSSSALAGKVAGDTYVTLMAKAPTGDTWVSMNTTGDSSNIQGVDVSTLGEIVLFSFDIHHYNRLDYIYMSDTSGDNVLGAKIYSTELSDNAFDTLTFVYLPQTDGSVITESYINGKFHSTKVNASGVNDIRIAMDAKSGQENNGIPFDNFKLVTVDEYVSPQLTNPSYIENGEVINFYEMTAAELKEAVAAPGLEISVVDASGVAVADSANVFTGMKLISKTTSLGKKYEITYPLASGQSHVEKAIAQVTIPSEATSDITLPTQIGGASISWSSSVPGIISNSGAVVRPQASDVVVTLTAVYTDLFKTETVTYDVVVASQGMSTTVSEVNAILSSHNAEPGKTISYDIRQVDDFGSWDLRYTVTSADPELIIDTTNKTLSSAVPGVYKVTFTGIDRPFVLNEIVAFGMDGSHHIYSSDQVYSENFDGDAYDANAFLPNASIATYNNSKAMYANSKNMNQSGAFGPLLSDYTFEADWYIDKCVGTSTENFTVRMRDTNTDPLSREGYNFSFMEFAYLSDTNPSEIGTAETGDYEKVKSVFGLSRGFGGTVHTWNFADTKQVLDVYNADNKRFNKLYHIVCTIIEDTMSAMIYDGETLLSTQVVKLSDLDRGKSRIEEGYTRFLTEYTGGYVDNIVLSTPSRWINSIKIELDDATLSPTENVTGYTVYGKSSGGEWIELADTEYTLKVSDDLELTITDGQITVNSDGTYSIGVSAGNLSHAVSLTRDANNTAKDLAVAELVIENADAIRNSFTLPVATGANQIIWESSNTAYITVADGIATVTRPVAGAGDKKVNLTATAYFTGYIVQKTIPVTVIAQVDEQAILNAAVELVSIPTETTSDITLPTNVGDEGVTVTWTSSNTKAISNTGAVTRATSDKNITLTAVFSVGSSSKTVNYIVNVPGKGAGQQGGKDDSPSYNGGPVYANPGETKPDVSQPPASSGVFADVKSDAWYYDSVKKAYELGLVNGVSANEFQPERSVNREEFIKILCNAIGIENVASSVFADVSDGSWYAPFVNAAVNAGIVSGISDSSFGVGLEISRQDMCVMIYRALLFSGVTLDTGINEDFADSDEIADYAKESVNALKAAGLVNGKGDNLFAPTGKTTRAEATTIILRMMDMLEKA